MTHRSTTGGASVWGEKLIAAARAASVPGRISLSTRERVITAITPILVRGAEEGALRSDLHPDGVPSALGSAAPARRAPWPRGRRGIGGKRDQLIKAVAGPHHVVDADLDAVTFIGESLCHPRCRNEGVHEGQKVQDPLAGQPGRVEQLYSPSTSPTRTPSRLPPAPPVT